jgi:hypothetical protein
MATTWSSLEIVKLLVAVVTPLVVAVVGIYLSRVAKRFEHLQWRNQRLIEKRIVIYDDLAPHFNDLLCYFTLVGCWKELLPSDVVALKRTVDKKIYLAAPLFSPEFVVACNEFMSLCFATFQGWGVDSKLRTAARRRIDAAGNKWRVEWLEYFADEQAEPVAVRAGYQRVMAAFSNDLGLNPAGEKQRLGRYPANV